MAADLSGTASGPASEVPLRTHSRAGLALLVALAATSLDGKRRRDLYRRLPVSLELVPERPVRAAARPEPRGRGTTRPGRAHADRHRSGAEPAGRWAAQPVLRSRVRLPPAARTQSRWKAVHARPGRLPRTGLPAPLADARPLHRWRVRRRRRLSVRLQPGAGGGPLRRAPHPLGVRARPGRRLRLLAGRRLGLAQRGLRHEA